MLVTQLKNLQKKLRKQLHAKRPRLRRGLFACATLCPMTIARKLRLYAELVILYGVIPVVVVFTEDAFPLLLTVLLILLGVIIAMRLTGWHYRELLILGKWSSWRNMLLVFIGSAVFWLLIVLYVWEGIVPFSFVQTRPDIWLMVMFFYPLVSALPQEILYRTFLWHRYYDLLPSKWWLISFSAIAFMWSHLLYMNWFAFTITLLGGFTFAWRYYHTRSLLLVAVEHGLYGNLFFTLGLGQFLFSGAV